MVSFFRRRRPRTIILYSRPGCHLCEDARALLGRLARRYPMHIEEIDISGDPDLIRAYDIRIPVLIIDGTHEIEAPITEGAVIRALK